MELWVTHGWFCESWRVVIDITHCNGCCSRVGQTTYCTVHILYLHCNQVLVFRLKKKMTKYKMRQEIGMIYVISFLCCISAFRVTSLSRVLVTVVMTPVFGLMAKRSNPVRREYLILTWRVPCWSLSVAFTFPTTVPVMMDSVKHNHGLYHHCRFRVSVIMLRHLLCFVQAQYAAEGPWTSDGCHSHHLQ